MRVAALYDIHGNLPALEAVLDEIRTLGVDRIVVGGDVLPGPMPSESLALLANAGFQTQYIQGNGDREALAWKRGHESATIPEAFRESMRWNSRQLTTADEQTIESWPATLRLDIPGIGAVLFCHATPRNDTDIFTRLTPDDQLAPVFAVDAPLVVCGHTHMQFDRSVGSTRIVNAGSVGMPFQEPGAYWLLLGVDTGGRGPERPALRDAAGREGVQLRRTLYDFEKAAERIRATAYPQAEEFASGSVLQPPSETAMVEAFTRVPLKTST